MSLGHIGRYELLDRLGQGGMAEVYVARPVGDPRNVVYALKCILPQYANDPRFVQMFHRELTVATGLYHSNLVSVLDHGRDQGRHFMVMEYVHGPDLAELLTACGRADMRPPIGPALSIVIAAARGLHHLHQRPGQHGGSPEFVHRDVSPSNVLVGFDGSVKVTDFGVATATAHTRTTDAGGVKGKVGYLSPEQCRSESLDRRTDIFALGVLLFEATLGERLFYGDNDYGVMMQIASGEHDLPSDRDPEYSSELEGIVRAALAPAREDRFPTASAFADAVEAFAEQHGIDTGAEVVAAWVTETVTWRPYPTFAPSPPPAAPVPAPAVAPRRSAPRSVLPWVLAGLAVPAIVGLTMMLTADDDSPAAAGSASAAPAAAAELPDPQAEPQPAQASPTPVPEPVAELEVEPDLEVEADPAPKARKRRPRKRRKKATKSSGPGYDLDAPRPPQ